MLFLPLTMILFAGVMTPGPASAVVLAFGFSGRPRDGVACAAGLTLVNLTYAIAVLTGLAALDSVSPKIRAGATGIGGLLLIWIGWKLWRGGWRAARALNRPPSLAPAFPASAPGPSASTRKTGILRPLLTGIAVQASNLNAMVFFASVFAAATPAGANLLDKAIILALVALISLGWYGGLGAVAGRIAAKGMGQGIWAARLRQTGGLAIIGFGGWIGLQAMATF